MADEEKKKGVCGDCIETMLTFNTRVFARYGYLVSNPMCAVVMFLLGSALVIGLACGITEVEYENDLDNLWVEKGSRAANERDEYNKYFGGPGRLDLIGYTLAKDKGEKDLKPADASDLGMLTKDAIYALANSSRDLLFETGKYNVTREMKLATGAMSNVTFAWKDFCSRPTLPAALSPWAFNVANPLQDVGYWLSQQTVGSGGLQFMTFCLSQQAKQALFQPTPLNTTQLLQLQMWFDMTRAQVLDLFNSDAATKLAATNARPGLPRGWGVDRAPCTRAAIHDLFAEGANFDYPTNLKLLDSYAYALATLSDQFTLSSTGVHLNLLNSTATADSTTTWYAQCQATLQSTLTLVVNQTQPPPAVLAGTVSTVMNAVGLFTKFAIGSGYWWRPSIEESPTPKALAQAIFQSLNNGQTYDSATCIAAGLYKKMMKLTTGTGATDFFFPVFPAFASKYGCGLVWSGNAVTRPLFVGGLTPANLNTSSTTDTYAAALRVSNSGFSTSYKFLLDRLKKEHSLASITTDQAENIVREIEQQMIDKLLTMRNRDVGSGYAEGEPYNKYEMYFLMDRSTGDLFDEAAKIEGNLLVGGYLALILFSCFNFVLFTCPPQTAGWVYSRAHLILLGLCTVGVSIAASFGFCGWVGFKLSPVNSTLIPFLGLGLGTSDIFVFVHELYRHRNHQDSPRERITMTLADAGSSVLVSASANVAAFLIPGAVVKLPAIYTFSIQMGICIILNWVTAMSLFVPCMVWNAYRTARKGLCLKTQVDESSYKGVSMDAFWTFFAEKALAPLYANIVFRIFAVCAFIAFTTGLAVHGFKATKNGLLLSDVVVRDHYAYDYLKLQEHYFDVMPGSLFTRPIDFTSDDKHITFPQFQANILKVIADTKNTDYMDTLNSAATLYFLPNFLKAVNPTNPVPIPDALFYPALQSYLAASGAVYISDLVCRNQTSKELITCEQVDGVSITLEATAGTTYFTGMVQDSDYVDAINAIRHDADNSIGNRYPMQSNGTRREPIPIFYAGSLFKYWQQYVTINFTAYKTVGFSLLGVFGVTCFTQASPLSSILVGVMLFATVLQLYGFMAILDIKLNGWSVTNLGVCVGMSVQTTAYYSSAFLRANAESDDPKERMKKALVEMFPPLINGAITSFIAVIVLAFAKFPFFRLYFFVMIGLMIALAFLNGVVFLPVLLSFVAPKGLDKKHHAISIAEPESMAQDGKKDALWNQTL